METSDQEKHKKAAYSNELNVKHQMECNRRKRAAVIEIHFHLDGWAEHFSEETGSVLM